MSTSPSVASVRSSARVNARYMQTFARHVDRLPEAERRAVKACVPQETWAAIDRAGALGWLGGETNLACTRAVSETLGPERAHDFYRTLLLSAFQTPLLRGLVEGALRFGFTDLMLYLPWVYRGFELLFRGCGRWNLVASVHGESTVELRGLPIDYVGDPFWLTSTASALSALFDLVKTTGTVVVRDVDVARGRAVFVFRWVRP